MNSDLKTNKLITRTAEILTKLKKLKNSKTSIKADQKNYRSKTQSHKNRKYRSDEI